MAEIPKLIIESQPKEEPLYAQAIAGLILWCIKIPIAVLILRLMDVIP